MTVLYTCVSVGTSDLSRCPDDVDGILWEALQGPMGTVEVWRHYPSGSRSQAATVIGNLSSIKGLPAPYESARNWWRTLSPDVQNLLASDPHGPVPVEVLSEVGSQVIAASWPESDKAGLQENWYLKGPMPDFIDSENARLLLFLQSQALGYQKSIELAKTPLTEGDPTQDPDLNLISEHITLARARKLPLPAAYL